MDKKWIKIIGFAATVIGIGASIVTDRIKDKEMEEKI